MVFSSVGSKCCKSHLFDNLHDVCDKVFFTIVRFVQCWLHRKIIWLYFDDKRRQIVLIISIFLYYTVLLFKNNKNNVSFHLKCTKRIFITAINAIMWRHTLVYLRSLQFTNQNTILSTNLCNVSRTLMYESHSFILLVAVEAFQFTQSLNNTW